VPFEAAEFHEFSFACHMFAGDLGKLPMPAANVASTSSNFSSPPSRRKVGQLRANVKNFTQRMIALANRFENARYDPALYLFSATRRVHGTLDAAPAIATGVVVDRILEMEDCHFVTELRGYGAAGASDAKL
jgi:hypothetical protein